MSVVTGYYWVVGGLGSEELHASLQLGDFQHRRNYRLTLRSHDDSAPRSISGDPFDVEFRIDEIKRIKGNRNHLKVGAVALLPSGLAEVCANLGFIHGGVSGTLQTVPRQMCEKCGDGHTTEKYCRNCGSLLRFLDIRSLNS